MNNWYIALGVCGCLNLITTVIVLKKAGKPEDRLMYIPAIILLLTIGILIYSYGGLYKDVQPILVKLKGIIFKSRRWT